MTGKRSSRGNGATATARAPKIQLGNVCRVIVYAKDWKQSLDFYKKTLGLKAKFADDCWAEFETGEATLCLHAGRKTVAKEEATPIVLFHVKNFDGAYEALKANGVKMSEVFSPCGGIRIATFADPSGNVLEIEGK